MGGCPLYVVVAAAAVVVVIVVVVMITLQGSICLSCLYAILY